MDNQLPQRLIQARAIRRMSQLNLATASGVAAAQISRYESGRSKPRAEVLARLSRALEVPFEWLLRGDFPEDASEAYQKSPQVSLTQTPLSDGPDQEVESISFRLTRAEDPIDVPAAELLELALELVSFHAERSALQTVMERMTKVGSNSSVVDGTRRQLEAVEADILDAQTEIRKLVAE